MSAATRKSLGQRWQRVRTVPGLGRDVSALVALVVVGLVAAGVILAQINLTPPWAQRFTFRVKVSMGQFHPAQPPSLRGRLPHQRRDSRAGGPSAS